MNKSKENTPHYQSEAWPRTIIRADAISMAASGCDAADTGLADLMIRGDRLRKSTLTERSKSITMKRLVSGF